MCLQQNYNYNNSDSILFLAMNQQQQQHYKPKQDFCKNHTNVPSGYFLPEQPWIKYCKTCALNVALCGKKIQKIFSSHELQRKIVVQSVFTQMKNCLEQAEENKFCYNKLIELFDEHAKIMSEKIKEISNALRDLTVAKKQLEQLYIQEVEKKVAAYSQRQNSFYMATIEVKRELQSIQSGFASFIESESQEEFQKCQHKWNDMVATFKKQMIQQEQYDQIRNKIWESVNLFYYQYEAITKFSFLPLKQQTLVTQTQHQFDFTLTPLTTNNPTHQSQPQDSKSLTKIKNHLKLRCNKRSDKHETTATKVSSKRHSCLSHESWSEVKQNMK